MFFPWVGLFEQIRLADKYVHYCDVQYSKGSFVNRVQVKTAEGVKWITVPLKELHLGQKICDVRVSYEKDWRRQHLEVLRRAYDAAPFKFEMLDLVENVYATEHKRLDELSRASIDAVCRYFGLDSGREFLDVRDLAVPGKGSRRVLEVVMCLGGDCYITGLGARNYLAHEEFDGAGVRVEYMNYEKLEYPQLHGSFTPYVTILDLIANLGRKGDRLIRSGTTYWKEYIGDE